VLAGLAIAPGPLMVLPFARIAAPRLAARLGGPGRVAVIGCAVNAGAQLLWLNMARQVGTVLGVAGLVAILSRVSRTDPVAAYRNGLVLVIAFFAAAGAVSAVLLTARPVAVPSGGAVPPSGQQVTQSAPAPAVPRST